MSQTTHYTATDHDTTPKPQTQEHLHGFQIMQEDTVHHIRPGGNWQAQDTSGMQVCNMWRYDDEHAEPAEKLLISAADATDKPTHFDGYGVEHFQYQDEHDRYNRTVEYCETVDTLADALEAYGFTVETDDSTEQIGRNLE